MKPMLAATLKNLEDVTFPVYVSPKMDGIRCLIHNGFAVSRTLKAIPNKFIQEKLKGLPDGLDGELMTKGDFNTVQSAVMSEDGEPEFLYVVFDTICEGNYLTRYDTMCKSIFIDAKDPNPFVKIVETVEMQDLAELKLYEHIAVKKGYEGIMLRKDTGSYKFGRSTLKEGFLLKYKRFMDAEAIIMDFMPLISNDNEATKDELGHTTRSTKKEGMVAKDTLGSLLVKDLRSGKLFGVGSGFNEEQRKEIWSSKEEFKGKIITYRYQDLTADGIPRFPIYKGVRYDTVK